MRNGTIDEIRARAKDGDYHCREHWGAFDADADVLFLIERLEHAEADLTALKARLTAENIRELMDRHDQALNKAESRAWPHSAEGDVVDLDEWLAQRLTDAPAPTESHE